MFAIIFQLKQEPLDEQYGAAFENNKLLHNQYEQQPVITERS